MKHHAGHRVVRVYNCIKKLLIIMSEINLAIASTLFALLAMLQNAIQYVLIFL
jgi:hypothetical protein